MTTPTRTEFEAAAYRWLNDPANALHPAWTAIIVADCTGEAMDTAIAAAMGWPTVPEVKS